MEEINLYLDDAKEQMENALKHASNEFNKIRAGKASPAMLEGLQVDYYGMMTPLNQVATLNNLDARTLIIKPFEKKSINDIEKAIRDADLGINPQNDGDIIRLVFPPLTEERRKDLFKSVKNEAEKARVNIRNLRKDTNDSLKKLQKDGASEDDVKRAEEKVQQLTDNYISKIETLVASKENEIMTI